MVKKLIDFLTMFGIGMTCFFFLFVLPASTLQELQAGTPKFVIGSTLFCVAFAAAFTALLHSDSDWF